MSAAGAQRRVGEEEVKGGGGSAAHRGREETRGRGDKNDNHRHFNNMQRHSRLPRRASAATMALYNDKDTPGRLGAFRSTKGAALGSSYRTGTCFVRRGQMSPIMFSALPGGRKSQNITVAPKIRRAKPRVPDSTCDSELLTRRAPVTLVFRIPDLYEISSL